MSRAPIRTVGARGTRLTRVGDDAYDIGYWIRASRAREGLATEAVAGLARVALAVCEVDRVEVHVDPRNTPSLGVPRKLGFREEATLRAKLLLGTLLVIVLVMTGVFVVVEHRQSAAIIDEVQRRGEVLARNLAAISEGPILLYNFTALEQNVARVVGEVERADNWYAFVARSVDGGRTFTEYKVSTAGTSARSMNNQPTFLTHMGDYIGISYNDKGVVAVWQDGRRSTADVPYSEAWMVELPTQGGRDG